MITPWLFVYIVLTMNDCDLSIYDVNKHREGAHSDASLDRCKCTLGAKRAANLIIIRANQSYLLQPIVQTSCRSVRDEARPRGVLLPVRRLLR